MYRALLLLLCVSGTIHAAVAGGSATDTAAPNGAFSFRLPAPANTSAGVFRADGTLVRTLWSTVRYPAGSHTECWDGMDDYGVPIQSPDAQYMIKVLSNNVIYEWQGVVGNTSSAKTGPTIHRGYYYCMRGLAITNGFGYYAQGYAEGHSAIAKFALASPQAKTTLLYAARNGKWLDTNFVAADATTVYWAGLDANSPANTMVYATKVADDTEVAFASGTPYKVTYGATLEHVIDKLNVANSTITGLAVQQKGTCLFVAHEALNELHVLNKTTGATIQTLSISRPRALAVDPADNLWMISATNTVSRYAVNSDDTLSTANLSLSGLADPLGLGISPDGARVLVGDGGNSQQIKAFLTANGAADWVFGSKGGYAADATVTNDRFAFSSVRGNELVFFAFEPDGSFWVNDGGNFRVQHYSDKRVFIDRIMSLGSNYSTWVDRKNITRLFSDFLEFNIDYSAPLSGGTGWTLVKNWGANVSTDTYDLFMKLKYPTTLSNGRTYAFLNRKMPPSRSLELVELPTTGTLRFTGIFRKPSTVLTSDGAIEEFDGTTRKLSRHALTGFDTANNPQWSTTGELLATVPPASPTEPFALPQNQSVSATGMVVFFNHESVYSYGPPKVYATGYHLGAIPKGGSEWLWKTERATHTNYHGSYPPAGIFDIGNGVNQFAGGNLNVLDRNVISSYHGEFWKASQTNKYNHYRDDGLAIGQFGTTRPETTEESAAQMAGNALTPVLVKDARDDLYLWHGDESDHAGVHRWKITGLDTIAEQAIPIGYPKAYKAPEVDYVDLMKGLPFDQPLVDNTAGWTRSPAADQETDPFKDAWHVLTSRLAYDRLSPDLYIHFVKSSAATHSVTRDLGSNSISKRWRITGELAYPGNMPNGIAIFQRLEVLDDAGKVLTTIQLAVNRGVNPFVETLTGNGKVIASGGSGAIGEYLNDLRSIEISVTAAGATFAIGKYAPVTAPIVDSAGNWQKPKSLRVRFENIGNGWPVYGAIINLEGLRFYTK